MVRRNGGGAVINPMEQYAGRLESVATRKAELDGFTVRVIMRDRQAFIVTRDFRTDRVNFVVRDGFVREAEVG